jgi:hypothetical protein
VKNPFKIGEKVRTKVYGNEVGAVVTALWQNEVQVRTDDGELRWRTMFTIWYPGCVPLQQEQKTAKAVVANNSAAKPAAAKAKKAANKQPRKRR